MSNKNSRQQMWNQRYQEKHDSAPVLPAALESRLAELQPGISLDLACGDGAASLSLARLGHRVTAIDFAAAALERLQLFSVRQGSELNTLCIDLDEPDALNGLGGFDNLIIFRYKPDQGLSQRLHTLLRPGGTLLIATFNLLHHQQTGFSRRFCLSPAELQNSFKALQLVEYSDGSLSGCNMDIYRFRK